MSERNRLEELRRSFWHLRKGGLEGLREHRRRRDGGGQWSSFQRARRRGKDLANHVPAWPTSLGDQGPRRSLKAGVILDPFSAAALGPEWHQVALTPERWQAEIHEGLDILFVESAWAGNEGAWRYQLTGSKAPSERLQELVATCKQSGVPTVFWNKEDPVHFEDFIDTARLFDWVYTTEESLVPRYQAELGHMKVGVLPFAAQPSIHNPVHPPDWTAGALGDVAFAGTYFRHKYPERRSQMDALLPAAAAAAKRERGSFDIYSRFQGLDENYEFPEPYDKHVRGELSYDQALTAYRGYKTFLNVNSVPDSKSMCARRIFEITACGTPVVSAPSPAIVQAFPEGGVFLSEDRSSAEDTIRALMKSDELRDRETKIGQRQIWRRHTYAHRVNQVLDDLGMEDQLWAPPTVSALVATNRPGQLRHVLDQLRQQKDVDLEVNVLTHGFEVSDSERKSLEGQLENVRWMTACQEVPLGELYNLLAKESTGDVVAKVDDDDHYGPYYLFDQLAALDYSGADVVGKGAHYMHLKGPDLTVLRFPDAEHKFQTFVSGPTIVANREIVLENSFPAVPRGEDTGFLRGVRDAGGTIYSSDRFGFIQVRNIGGEHTWDPGTERILATSRVLTYGSATKHVIF